MTDQSRLVPGGEQRVARFNYLASSVPHSLYRNGNVSLTRNPDGTDARMDGYVEDAHEKFVYDARSDEKEATHRAASAATGERVGERLH